MNFNELVEKTVGIQVSDVSDTLKDLQKAKIKAKRSSKYDDEIVVDVKDKNKVVKWMLDVGGWEEQDIEDLYPELLESDESVKIDTDELIENCAGRLPIGMQKALFTNSGVKSIKKECDKCGFLMPKYKGRYPNYCAMCGDAVTKDDKEVVSEGE